MSVTLRPLAEADFSRVRAVFTDVDGTLTTGGKLSSATLRALEWLGAHRVPVVLVSGRPSGWGECWARQWPVAGVIVENGGLHYAWRDGALVKRWAEPPLQRARNRAALRRHVAAVLRAVPGARLSSDSAATEVDLAIDYAEDVRLGAGAADRLEALLARRGVTAVRSSVHLNCWLGPFDKLTAARRFLKLEWGQTLHPRDARWVYVGDSLNDAPLFGGFPLSVGVANVLDVVDRLEAKPAFVTHGREGRGFAEVADAISRAKRSRS
jgi:hypothetical protein